MATKSATTKKASTKKAAEPARAIEQVDLQPLVAAIYADPTSAAAYAAYADGLTRSGDPQGEVIALALAAEVAEGDEAKGAKSRAAKALKKFVEGTVVVQFPALAEVFAKKEKEPGAVKWKRGVIDTIDTFYWKKTPELAAAVEGLMRSPLTQFVRQLFWREFEDLVDVSAVGRMEALEWLALQKNPRVVALPSCARLQRLWKVEIGRSGITDLGPLAEARGVRYVSMDNTQVASLAPLYGHEQLWEVWCRNTQVTAEDAAGLRARMEGRPPGEKPNGGMSKRDVFGP